MKRISFIMLNLWLVVFTSQAEAKVKSTLQLFIWGEYTSPALLQEFTKRTGIEVKESNYGSNEELLAKLQGGARGYDIAVPSDYMVGVLQKLGLVAPLDKTKLTNFGNLDPYFLGKYFDPENKFSVPYSWTTSGLAYNNKVVKTKITSWGDLFVSKEWAGKLSILDDMREGLGAALKFAGRSMNSKNAAEVNQAARVLLDAKPRFRTFNVAPGELLKSGDVVLAHMYAQEALLANKEMGGKLSFVVPKEGSTLAIDNMVILKDAPNKEAAHQFINFMLEINSSATLVAEKFAGPVLKDLKSKLPKSLQSNSILFPESNVFQGFEMLQDLDDATDLYEKAWSEVKTAKK